MVKTHTGLIEDIDVCTLEHGQCAFWWLGQLGFALKLGKTVVYLDPFLSEHPNRLVPPLLDPAHIQNTAVVFGSHDHADHIDRPAWRIMAAKSSAVRFVVPEALLPGLAQELAIPLKRFIGLNDGTSISIDNVVLSGIAAAHEFLDRDPVTGRYLYLGCIIQGNGCTVYHAGDTCWYEGLVKRLLTHTIDICFLPINGRDAKRYAAGCIGNMTYQEAADLAGEIRPRLCVPAHYDMFAMNSEDPRLFTDYMRVKYPDIPVCVCRHGERVGVGPNYRAAAEVHRS